MMSWRYRSAYLALTLLLSGCTFPSAHIYLRPIDRARAFSTEEQDEAKRITMEIARPAGFEEVVRSIPPTSASVDTTYIEFLSLGAPPDKGGYEQDTVGIGGVIRKDRREIIISLADTYRTELIPATETMIEDLRSALARAFPDATVAVETENTWRGFGP